MSTTLATTHPRGMALKEAIATAEQTLVAAPFHEDVSRAIQRLIDHAKKNLEAIEGGPKKQRPEMEFSWLGRMLHSQEPILVELITGQTLHGKVDGYSHGWIKILLDNSSGSVLVKHSAVLLMRKVTSTALKSGEKQ